MQYSHAIPIEHNLPPGPLWPFKHTAEELEEMKTSDGYNFSAQYEQNPHQKGGSIFLNEWWGYYSILPPDFEYKAIFCDTALKDGQHNDYSVFQCWAKYEGRIYLVDQFRQKIKAVDLKRELINFWNSNKGTTVQPNRGLYIEDKSSGTQLIQDIQRIGGIPVIAIPRNKSKIERANNLVNWIKSGLLFLPEKASYIQDYKIEFEAFSPLMTHKHDDQIDPTLDAIENMLINDGQVMHIPKDEKRTSLAPRMDSKSW